MDEADTFIERAEKIVDKFVGDPTQSVKAQEEAHVLVMQFEEYLQGRGLKRVPSRNRRI